MPSLRLLWNQLWNIIYEDNKVRFYDSVSDQKESWWAGASHFIFKWWGNKTTLSTINLYYSAQKKKLSTLKPVWDITCRSGSGIFINLGKSWTCFGVESFQNFPKVMKFKTLWDQWCKKHLPHIDRKKYFVCGKLFILTTIYVVYTLYICFMYALYILFKCTFFVFSSNIEVNMW